jgi:hypothetical protein
LSLTADDQVSAVIGDAAAAVIGSSIRTIAAITNTISGFLLLFFIASPSSNNIS